ncbi:MAG TPA: LysR family transcriptional regulator [Hyphomonadaceae bacterium]|nr:LysR family transcriptional regulator [Hyphomonadaceae bacterium]
MGGAKLDWERLKVFQTVADTGSINAAAKALSRSYTKVSSDLDELERALGHQLFERSHRGLELTAVGEDILRSARSMADSVQAIVERASERNSDRLVICTREGIATYWLARRLPELLSLQPDARVFLKVLPTTPNLADGDGDIAIQFEKPAAANLVSRQLGWLHYILYAAPSYLAQHGEPNAMSDLQAHQCLRLSGAEYQPESWRQAAAAWGAILPDTVGTDAGTVLMEACASGAGIAALPSYVSQFDDRLTPLTHIKPLATLRFWLTYTERVRSMEASQPVLHWIRSCFDPVRHPCFREVYVPPQRRLPAGVAANDTVPATPERAPFLNAEGRPLLQGPQTNNAEG